MMDVGAERYRPHSPHVQQLRGPNLSELDFKALRANRLARLQAKMKLHQIPVSLFYNPANTISTHAGRVSNRVFDALDKKTAKEMPRGSREE